MRRSRRAGCRTSWREKVLGVLHLQQPPFKRESARDIVLGMNEDFVAEFVIFDGPHPFASN
jgi:hypothetical protein